MAIQVYSNEYRLIEKEDRQIVDRIGGVGWLKKIVRCLKFTLLDRSYFQELRVVKERNRMLEADLERSKTDNVKLYEKIRYVQDYTHERPLSRGPKKVPSSFDDHGITVFIGKIESGRSVWICRSLASASVLVLRFSSSLISIFCTDAVVLFSSFQNPFYMLFCSLSSTQPAIQLTAFVTL